MNNSINTKTMPCYRQPKSVSVWTRLVTFFAVARQRRHLRTLDAHLLKDIGVTRQEALSESRKITWDAPQTWRK